MLSDAQIIYDPNMIMIHRILHLFTSFPRFMLCVRLVMASGLVEVLEYYFPSHSCIVSEKQRILAMEKK